MKKQFLFLLGIFPLFVFSQKIDSKDLIKYANNAFAQKEYNYLHTTTNKAIERLDFITDINNDTLMLAVQYNGGGFIIMSATESVHPVLAFSIDDPLELNNALSGVSLFLDEYKLYIFDVFSGKEPADADAFAEWQKIKESALTVPKTVMRQNLFTAKWNQTIFYNHYSPLDPASPSGYDGRCPNGCVAVAMAQIMYFYRYPKSGQGSHTNYTNYGSYFVNFGQQHYDYNAMADVLTSYNNEVAKLIFHCATSVNMMYGPDGSGAYSSDVPDAMINYFKYNNSVQQVSKSQYNNNTWRDRLRAELNYGRPMYYSGYNNNGGHAFVCDGYDASDETLFHFNFGWGGSSNGYYLVSNASNAINSYSNGQAAVVNIFPKENYPEYCTNETTIITASYGTLEDGSNINNYQNNSNCKYLIATTGSSIVVTIQYLETEEDNDTLSFWDGDPDNGGTLYFSLSGNMQGDEYTFNTDSLYITFKTNATVTANGWRLSYKSLNYTKYCSGTRTLRTLSGVIEDYSGNANYAPGESCSWNIIPDQYQNVEYYKLIFHKFDLSDEDFIYIAPLTNHQPALYFCGSESPQELTLYTSAFKFVFKSDNYLEKDGFYVEWYTNLSANADENRTNTAQIYPNPATSFTNISFNPSLNNNLKINISDVTGKTIRQFIHKSQTNIINLNTEELANGVYFVNLSNSSTSITKKLIVNH